MEPPEEDPKNQQEADIAQGNKSVFLKPLVDRRTFIKGMAGMFGVSVLGLGKGYANTDRSEIVLEKVPVSLPRLPKTFRGLKIAQLSDLHSSPIVSQEHIRQAADLAFRASAISAVS